jgi:hypothetical protein
VGVEVLVFEGVFVFVGVNVGVTVEVKVGVGVLTAVDVGVGLLFTDIDKFVLHIPVEFTYTTVAFISTFTVYPDSNC